MLTITPDDTHDCLILRPTGSLRKADLDALTAAVDERAASGSVPNLVVQSPGFPTWSNLAAMLEHLRFIRGHHREIGKVALVSDARAFDLAPRIARLFVSARLRHFPADALDEALDWVADRAAPPPDVTLIEGLPDDSVGVSVRGVVDAGDYSRTIAPVVEAALARHDRINLVYEISPEFETFTAGALWSDALLGAGHLTRFGKVALVTDLPWMRTAAQVFAPLVPTELRVFGDLKDARAWIEDAETPAAPEPAG